MQATQVDRMTEDTQMQSLSEKERERNTVFQNNVRF